MGIHGLLPLLKSVMVPFHIKELEGCSVAVDTYSWLHKGALSCSTQLCKGLPTTRHIEYCMHRVNLLRHYGVKPILVFDGGFLPMKIEQENKRARSRKENLARAVEHESNGNSAAAYECYQKAVDISPSIAHDLIQILKKENVSFVVAPYEADAQMTFLAISKQVHAVITEDSDLIPFGCPRIIFKMDKYGQGVEFHYSRLQRNKELSFVGFSHKMILEMCILSGCDYLQSLPGMGLKRAHALISKFKSYEKVIKHLKYSTVCVPPTYEESFQKALMTFQHQRVYDPVTEAMVHLSDLSDNDADDLDFLGPMMPRHLAKGIAEGNLDPFTCLPFKGGGANSDMELNRTAELKNVKPEKGRKKLDLPVQKNILTKYFCFASLEAKRSFTAPRKSPVLPVPVDESSPSAKELSQFSPGNVESTPPEDTVQSDSAAEILGLSEASSPDIGDEKESSDHILPSKSGDSALLKECDNKNVPVLTENKKIVTRSSYFKPKSSKNGGLDDQQEKLSANNGAASDTNILRSSYKTIVENNKVVVRSSYFQSKSNKNYQNTLQEKHLPKVDKAMDSDQNRDFITEVSKNGCHALDRFAFGTKTEEKKIASEISHLGQYSEITDKSMDSDKNQDFITEVSKNGCHALDCFAFGTKTEEKKIASEISHLGQYSEITDKSMDSVKNQDFITEVSKNGCHSLDRFVFGTKTEEKKIASHLGQYSEITDKSMDSDKNRDFITEGASRNNAGFALKRKASMNDSINENMKPKQKRVHESFSENGCHVLDRFEFGTKTEEKKFGSNISHLGQYSDIADKSMDRFVSAISSFRYSSTGSRASGLRAPLKDIRNTHPNRSNPDLDLSRFAYKPKIKNSSGV